MAENNSAWKQLNLGKGQLALLVIFLVFAFALTGCSSDSTSAGDEYSTYDDFTGTTLDTTKWNEDDVDAGGNISIVSNALQADLAADGTLANNNARISMADAGDPGSVTGLEVSVNVSEATETSGGIRARLQGSFYNDGTVGGEAADSSTSDVLAIMQMTGFAGTASTTATYVIVRCTNTDCTTNEGLTSGDLGKVSVDEDHTFQMEFDSSTSTFTLTMDSDASITVDMDALGAAYSTDPLNPLVRIGIRGNNTPEGSMTATFDDFRCKGCTVP